MQHRAGIGARGQAGTGQRAAPEPKLSGQDRQHGLTGHLGVRLKGRTSRHADDTAYRYPEPDYQRHLAQPLSSEKLVSEGHGLPHVSLQIMYAASYLSGT
jgi:hypothetical protein